MHFRAQARLTELSLAHDHLTYDDLLRIVELIKTSEQFSEFRLKVGDIEVELRRHGAGTSPVTSLTPQSTLLPAAPADAMQPAPETNSLSLRREVGAPSPAMTALPEDAIVIRAPMVGTFYRAPEPGAQPFVEVGQSVEPDAIVCIIEVMKLMNSIHAEAGGIVMQILVDDGAAVETRQPLIVLQREPAAQ